ncbi:MAG: sugar MFS transporter [Chitinophagaceae bacterium]
MEKPVATVDAGSLSKRDTVVSMAFIGMLFFIFGFVTWVNAILIPYFKIACELSNFQSYLVAFAFYISYLLISVPASYLLNRVGFKKGMMLGFWFMSFGAIVFVMAAFYRAYPVFLAGLFSIGAGLSVLQTAANPYITILGPRESAAQRISIMGICNKGAGILAPLLFAAVIFRPNDTALFNQLHALSADERSLQLDLLIRRVIVPYTIVAAVLALLGFLVRVSPLPEINTSHEAPELAATNAGKKSIFEFPHLILGAVAIFLHVGTQVIAVDTIISYAGTMGIKLVEAKVFPSYTLFATITGYILGIILIPKYVSQLHALRFCTMLGFLLSLLIYFTHGQVVFLSHATDISIWFVVALGFANSLVWAGIWPLALHELGKFTKLGASVMIMGLCGNAFLPLIYGHFADAYGPRAAYLVLLPCYAYLIFYAVWGYRIRRWKTNQ